MRPSAPRLLLAFTLSALLVGCAPAANVGISETGSSPSSGAVGTAPAPSRAEGQTLWSVAGTGEQIPDDDPDAQAVRTLITVHSGVIDNRDLPDIDDSLKEEFSFYTPEFTAKLDGVQWRESSRERTVTTEAAAEQRGVAWLRSTIDTARTTAEVQYESYIVFTEGNDAFLKANNIVSGTEYAMTRQVTARASGGQWLIDDVKESGLSQRATPSKGNRLQSGSVLPLKRSIPLDST